LLITFASHVPDDLSDNIANTSANFLTRRKTLLPPTFNLAKQFCQSSFNLAELSILEIFGRVCPGALQFFRLG